MRYTSSHPRTFRNRIAKSIGVLVAAALVATWGCPLRPGTGAVSASPTSKSRWMTDDVRRKSQVDLERNRRPRRAHDLASTAGS